MCKDLSKSSSNKIINADKQEVALGKQNLIAACPMDNSSFFFEPWIRIPKFQEFSV